GSYDGFPAIREGSEQRDVNRRHAGTASQSAMSVFEGSAKLFERGIGGVIVPCIAEARLFPAKDAIELLDIFVEEAGRGVNRCGHGNMAAGLFAVARVHRLRVRLYFLFQRTPSLVS